MQQLRIFVLISYSILCSVSCGTQPAAPPPNETRPDLLVGRVAAVYLNDGYMLIQRFRTIKTNKNTVFYTRAQDGKIHSITLNEQSLGQFYVADIKEDLFTVNDPLFMRTIESASQADKNQRDTEILDTSL